MGWDNWTNSSDLQDKSDIESNLKETDVGLQEFEVEKTVTFVVKYKTLAKDKYSLDHLYLGCANLDIGDTTEDNKKVYDFSIKNYGESDEKTRQTLNEVEKIYDDEDHQRGDDFEIKISHGGF